MMMVMMMIELPLFLLLMMMKMMMMTVKSAMLECSHSTDCTKTSLSISQAL